MPRYYKRYRSFESRERDVIPGVSRTLAPPPDQHRLSRLEREEFVRSPDNKKWLNAPPWAVKDQPTFGPKVALKATALLEVRRRLSSFKEEDFSNPQKRAAYRALRATEEGLKKSPYKAAVDNRRYNPAGKDWPYTVWGTAGRTAPHSRPDGRQMYWLRNRLLPCVERVARRSVLFALGKGGKGFRTPHHRNPNSGVPC